MNTAYLTKSPSKSLTGLKIFTVLSFLASGFLGTVCHFAYDYFGKNVILAPFVPVNESTWEHLKLLFFPVLICLIIGIFLGFCQSPSTHPSDRSRHSFASCYLDGAAFGLIGGMLSIVVLFYSINGFLGFNIDWINIAIFFISTAYAYYTFYRYASKPYYNTFSYNEKNAATPLWVPITVITIIAVLFAVFTFYMPKIGLFRDPQTGSYGLTSSLLHM